MNGSSSYVLIKDTKAISASDDTETVLREVFSAPLASAVSKWIYSKTHLNIALIIKEAMGNTLKYSNGAIWLLTPQNTWNHHRREWEIRLAVTQALETVMEKTLECLSSLPVHNNGKIGNDKIDIRKLEQEMLRVQNQAIIALVIPLLLSLVKDDQFSGLIDTNWGLLPFKNGAMVLDTLTFRPMRPDDYISRVLDYEYNPAPDVAPVTEYLDRIMPDPVKQRYLIQRCSLLLSDRCPNNKLLLLLGPDDFGKSIFIKLLFHTLSSMFSAVPSTILYRDTEISGAVLMMFRSSRLATISSLSNRTISSSAVKRLCGVSQPSSGGTSSSGFRAKLIAVANSMPSFTVEDSTLWSHLETILFEQPFNEFREKDRGGYDTTVQNIRSDAWKQSFVFMLLGAYKDLTANLTTNGTAAPVIPADFRLERCSEEEPRPCSNLQEFLSNFLVKDDSSVLRLEQVVTLFLDYSKPGNMYSEQKNKLKQEVRTFIINKGWKCRYGCHRITINKEVMFIRGIKGFALTLDKISE